MVARTARGTASDKSSGLTLTVSSVLIVPDSSIIIGISYDSGQGAPELTWGANTLIDRNTTSGGGIVTKVASFYKDGGSNETLDAVATWDTTAPTAKAMFVTQVTEVGEIDAHRGTSESATGSPSSGNRTTEFFDEFLLGAMGSEGPSGDTAGTPGNSYTAGQRVGTAGIPPASNITIQEIFKLPNRLETTSASLTGATSRDWSSVLVTFRPPLSAQVRDEQFMNEQWREFLAAAEIVEAGGSTIAIEDGSLIDITDRSDLYLTKT